MMPSSPKPVAQATYKDAYGERRTYLVPSSKRGGQAVYRWVIDGMGEYASMNRPCDGLTHGHALPRMLAHARANRQFSNVEVL